MKEKSPIELKIIGKILSVEPNVNVDSFGIDFSDDVWDYFIFKDAVNNNYWNIRYPKDEYKNNNIEEEFNLLTKINLEAKTTGININIPNPKHIIKLKGANDNLVELLLYKKLPGFALNINDLENNPELIEETAKAIAFIHSFNTDLLKDVNFPKSSSDEVKDEVQNTLTTVKSAGYVSERLIDYFQKKFLNNKKLWKIKPTLIHGNLHSENLLTYNNKILSIENFSSAKVSDPAKDLKNIVSGLSHEVRSELLKSYKSINNHIDGGFEDRINFLIDFAWFEYLLFGAETNNDEIIKDALNVIGEMEDRIFPESPNDNQ